MNFHSVMSLTNVWSIGLVCLFSQLRPANTNFRLFSGITIKTLFASFGDTSFRLFGAITTLFFLVFLNCINLFSVFVISLSLFVSSLYNSFNKDNDTRYEIFTWNFSGIDVALIFTAKHFWALFYLQAPVRWTSPQSHQVFTQDFTRLSFSFKSSLWW